MNITAKFYFYFFLATLLPLLFVAGWYSHFSISIISALLFVILYFGIKRDFVDPLTSVWQWLGSYQDSNDYDGIKPNSTASFLHVSSAIDHLAKENQSLYDDMEAVLNHQVTRLSKKTAFLEILYSMSERINQIDTKEAIFTEFLQTLINMSSASGGIAREVIHKDGKTFFTIAAQQNTHVSDEELFGLDAPCLNANGVQFSVYNCPSCTKNTAHIGTIFIPLIHKEKHIGAFGLFFDTEPSLAYDERMLLQTIGDNVAIYVDKLNQIEQSKQHELFKERLYLSQDIHDNLAQTIYSLNIGVSMLKDSIVEAQKIDNHSEKSLANVHPKITTLEQNITKANTEIRSLIENFRKQPNEASELKKVLDAFTASTSIKLYSQIEEVSNSEVSKQLTMIVSEALANIKKHSRANNTRVMLGGGQLLIEDDGVGFDISNSIHTHDVGEKESVESGEYHLGIRVMRERAERIGATFYIESDKDSGTIIVVNYTT